MYRTVPTDTKPLITHAVVAALCLLLALPLSATADVRDADTVGGVAVADREDPDQAPNVHDPLVLQGCDHLSQLCHEFDILSIHVGLIWRLSAVICVNWAQVY